MLKCKQEVNCMVWWKHGEYLIESGYGAPSHINIRAWYLPYQLEQLQQEDNNNNNNYCIPNPNGTIIRNFKSADHVLSNVTSLLLLDEDGDELLSSGSDTEIKMWDLNSGTLIKQFEGHKSQILALCKISNTVFASASQYNTIKLWNSVSGTCIYSIGQIVEAASIVQECKLAYSLHEQVLVACTENQISAWNMRLKQDTIATSSGITLARAELKLSINEEAEEHEYKALALVDDGSDSVAIIGDTKGRLRGLNIRDGTILYDCASLSEEVTALAVVSI